MNNWKEELIFTTQDGIQVPVGTNVHWVIHHTGGEVKYAYDLTLGEGHKGIIHEDSIYKIFALKDNADNYVIEQNKPKYEVGEWLYFENSHYYGIFRFESFSNNEFKSNERYWFAKENTVLRSVDTLYTSGSFSKDWNIQKATPEHIQTILSKVALSKGFKEGVSVKLYKTATWPICKKTKFVYYPSRDGLAIQLNDSEPIQYIYQGGKWLEPIENTVPEYVECVKWGGCSHTEGKIYKVINGMIQCDEFFNELLKPTPSHYDIHKNSFKPSTKEQFDLQNNSKQVTVIVDGQVTSVSSYGSEVKINYQIK